MDDTEIDDQLEEDVFDDSSYRVRWSNVRKDKTGSNITRVAIYSGLGTNMTLFRGGDR